MQVCSTFPCLPNAPPNKSHHKHRNRPKAHGDPERDSPLSCVLMETAVAFTEAPYPESQCNSLLHVELLQDRWVLRNLDSCRQESEAGSVYCAMISMTKKKKSSVIHRDSLLLTIKKVSNA